MNVFPETNINKRYTTNRKNIMYVVSVIYLSFLALDRDIKDSKNNIGKSLQDRKHNGNRRKNLMIKSEMIYI